MPGSRDVELHLHCRTEFGAALAELTEHDRAQVLSFETTLRMLGEPPITEEALARLPDEVRRWAAPRPGEVQTPIDFVELHCGPTSD